MKAVFFGTPDFAVDILKKLMFRHDVTLVVTRSDKAQGRKKIITKPPVKVFAEHYGIEVIQPESLRNKEFTENFAVKTRGADIFIVAAYGRILPKAVLNMPRLFCVNVHASLLPKYRGAAPVHRAIMSGETETGITIMRMDEGLDTGDIILQSAIPIEEVDTGGSLTQKLSVLGAAVLIDALDQIENGTAAFTKQDDTAATYAPVITKNDCPIDFNGAALDIYNRIRALLPENNAFISYKNGKVKILHAGLSDTKTDAAPGVILAITDEGVTVACRDGAVTIKEVIPQGGKRMDAVSFINGRRIKTGDVL